MCACVCIPGEQHVCVKRLFYDRNRDITSMCERACMYACVPPTVLLTTVYLPGAVN